MHRRVVKNVPRVRLELTTFRSLLAIFHYETDALPTALPRHLRIYLKGPKLYPPQIYQFCLQSMFIQN